MKYCNGLYFASHCKRFWTTDTLKSGLRISVITMYKRVVAHDVTSVLFVTRGGVSVLLSCVQCPLYPLFSVHGEGVGVGGGCHIKLKCPTVLSVWRPWGCSHPVSGRKEETGSGRQADVTVTTIPALMSILEEGVLDEAHDKVEKHNSNFTVRLNITEAGKSTHIEHTNIEELW